MKTALIVLLATVVGWTQPRLSPGAAEMAKLLSVESLLDQPTLTTDARLELTEDVLASSLEIDGIIAEIENEIARAGAVRTLLEADRDRHIGLNTIANIITGGGVGAAGQALQIKHSTAGNLLGAITGGVSTVLSFVAIRQAHGGKAPLGASPNMLAKLFDRTPEFHSDYPAEAWAYLNAVPPSETTGESRRQKLIRQWTAEGRTGKNGARIDLLTSSISQQKGLTIDVISDRTAMLGDVRATLYLMKRDLGKLLQYVRDRRKADKS